MGQAGGVGVRVGTCALPRGNMGHGAWLPAVSGEPELSSLSFINFSHQVSPYSMDDTDPQKFFMSGERKWVVKGMGRPQDVLTQHLPHPQASRATCPVLASSLAPASLCSPTRRCRNLGRRAHGAGHRRTPNLFPRLPSPNFQNLDLLLH